MNKLLFMGIVLFYSSFCYAYDLPQNWTEVVRTVPSEFVLTTKEASVSQDNENWFNIVPADFETDLATLSIGASAAPTQGKLLAEGIYPYMRTATSGVLKVKASASGYVTTGNLVDVLGYGPVMEAQLGSTPVETTWGSGEFGSSSSDPDDPLIVTSNNTIICTINVTIEDIIILATGLRNPNDPESTMYAFFVDTSIAWFGHNFTESD